MDLYSIYQTILLFGVYIFRNYFSHKLAELIYIGQISVFECKEEEEKDDEKMKIKQENIDNKWLLQSLMSHRDEFYFYSCF